jgi:phosphatidylserine decarboxylase
MHLSESTMSTRAVFWKLVLAAAFGCGLGLVPGRIRADEPAYLAPVRVLEEKAKSDVDFERLLTESLKKAQTIAQNELDHGLYEALAWPEDLQGYIQYLKDFARWVPQQSGAAVWKKPGTDGHQEVYDRLCHFYWLINQEVGQGKTIVQDVPWFSECLVRYARTWGEFLNTTESFDDNVLQSFLKHSPEYRVGDSMFDGRPNSPSGWLTFNQFFARHLNPGLRPIDSPCDNSVVTSPADCTFKAKYPIGPNSTIKEVRIKKTHTFASVENLLDGSRYKNEFQNGVFAHYFLGPYSYHRFHAPVSGKVIECRAVPGLVYLEVNIKDGQFDAPDDAQGGYQFSQARGIIVIDTSESEFGDVGLVAIVPIGMAQVSSVNMTATEGGNLLKGQEFGYFLFGGSDIIVLFQAGRVGDFDANKKTYRHYGTKIATCKKE